jgi:hypothetical protein
MHEEAVVVFTRKSTERIIKEGGSCWWRLDRNRARQCDFALCTRNAKSNQVEGRETHHSGFLAGKISDVVPAPDRPNRFLIQFSEFARVDILDAWRGDRNPVKYVQLNELGVDFSQLKWEPVPKSTGASNPAGEVKAPTTDAPLTIAQAKKGLALTFGVAPEAIEITIHG